MRRRGGGDGAMRLLLPLLLLLLRSLLLRLWILWLWGLHPGVLDPSWQPRVGSRHGQSDVLGWLPLLLLLLLLRLLLLVVRLPRQSRQGWRRGAIGC